MHQAPVIHGLIFDNGDILYDAAAWRRWLTKHLQGIGIAVSYDELVACWEQKLVDVYRGNAEYWERFHELLADLGVPETKTVELIELARSKGQQLQNRRQPMPGVGQTLKQLHELGIKLGVLSDTESGEAGVRQILAQLEIEAYFDAVIASRDIGTVKPAALAFELAVQRIGLPKSACGFVGHDIDELQGASECGLVAIAYNYHPQAPADFFLDHFGQLIDLVTVQPPGVASRPGATS